MTSMRERIARAIGKGIDIGDWAVASAVGEQDLFDAADAVLDAMREPTEAMIDAYFDRCRELGFTAHINASAAWQALWGAARDEGLPTHEDVRGILRDRDRSADADRREAAGPEGQEPGPKASPESIQTSSTP